MQNCSEFADASPRSKCLQNCSEFADASPNAKYLHTCSESADAKGVYGSGCLGLRAFMVNGA